MNWIDISNNEQISEDFVREHADKLHWRYLSINTSVSESLLKEMEHRISDWGFLSSYRTLSEDFIHHYKDKLNWHGISGSQPLSFSFIKEHISYINFNRLEWANNNVSFTEEQWDELAALHKETHGPSKLDFFEIRDERKM